MVNHWNQPRDIGTLPGPAILCAVMEVHKQDHPGSGHRILSVMPGYGTDAGPETSRWIVTLEYDAADTQPPNGGRYIRRPGPYQAVYGVLSSSDIRIWMD